MYTTLINVYALHRCLDSTDHYVVTAQADWTATDARWQGVSTEDGTLYKNGDTVETNWQDGYTVNYCASASSAIPAGGSPSTGKAARRRTAAAWS